VRRPHAPGCGGNHGYEDDYEFVHVDADGAQLNGAHRYELRLAAMPPVDAFWSLTMYNVPEFVLVDNPIDRYSIGDRTPGLHVAVPAFGPENALFAPNSWLFGLQPVPGPAGVVPVDPVAAVRAIHCATWVCLRDVAEPNCTLASLGHPTAAGARAYFEAIRPYLG
jgi:Protein of unknown function (DUF1214)